MSDTLPLSGGSDKWNPQIELSNLAVFRERLGDITLNGQTFEYSIGIGGGRLFVHRPDGRTAHADIKGLWVTLAKALLEKAPA